GNLKLWNSAGALQFPPLKVAKRNVRAVAYSPDAALLATAGDDKLLKLWTTDTRTELTSFKNYKGPITSLAFAPDSSMVASGGGGKNPEIKVWNVAARLEMANLTGHSNGVLAI